MKNLLSLLLLFTIFLSAQNYESAWTEVQEFEKKSLPKSALKRVESIYTEAKSEKNEIQFIKALLYKEKYLLTLNQDGYIAIIKDLEKAIKESPKKGTQLILYSILAQVYEYYLERNHYRINQRSRLKQDASSDIKTWSIDKLSKKSSELYLKSLDKKAKDIPINKYKALLNKGSHVQELQPTLYDFLAFRALGHFVNPRNTLNRKENFTIKDPDAFASAYTFMYLSFSSELRNQLQYNALVIYQELLKLHREKHHKKALDAINIQRLLFVYRNFSIDKKEQYYINALKSILLENPKSEALITLANSYYDKENYPEAMLYVEQALKSSNEYIINKASILKYEIEAKHLKFQIEQVNLPHENILAKVKYKNIQELFVNVIRLNSDKEAKLDSKKDSEKLNYIKTLEIFKKFTIRVPKKNDYKSHSIEISLDHYDVGKYIVILSLSKEIDKHAIYKTMSISNIAYMKQGNRKLLVVHRQTGEPLKGVEVSFYETRYTNNGKYEKSFHSTRSSDKEGKVDLPKIDNNFEMTFKYKKDFLDLRDNHYYNRYDREPQSYTRTFVNFFTDRAIYRPNQSIYFKGLALQTSTNKAPKILKNRKIKVSFYNRNHQLIEEKTFTSNDFGTFHGEFTAPKNGLLGSMLIEADMGGRKSVQIEEYKRPKFEVNFKQLEKSYKIGDNIELKGEAKAYAGNALDNAKVSYTIKRLASFPWVVYWKRHNYYSYEQTIDRGSVKTDKNGEFKIHFDALADTKFDSKDRPNYNYTISVDVTDSTGETHTARKNILLGYVGIQVSMNIDTELNIENNNTLTIDSTNLDGKFQAIQGEILIEKFIKEEQLYRKRYWQEAKEKLYSKEEFKKLFKHYRYHAKDTKQEKELIKTLTFDTQKNKEIELDNLEQGAYLLTLKSHDQYGVEVSTSKKVTIYNLKANTPPITTYLWHKNDQKEYKTPSKAKIYLKSSTKKLPVLLSIEREGKLYKERWITIEKVKEELIKISKKDRGNIHYQLNFIYDNRAVHIQDTLVVPWDSKLNIELISFRDTLKPNEKEQWKVKISGKNREKIMAEMVATMYDASLDKFIPHQFSLYSIFPTFQHNYNSNWKGINFTFVSQQKAWQEYQEMYIRREFPSLKWLNIGEQPIYYEEVGGGGKGGMVMDSAYEEAMPSPVVASQAMVVASAPRAKSVPLPESGSSPYALDSINQAKNRVKESVSKPTPHIVHIRKNFNETMFFKPNLQTDKEGNIIINFKTNEALTRWNFIGFAHSKGLKTATINKTLTTKKELMVVSNLPRFFREKDKITLSAKVVNMSDKDLEGECELQLVDPLTEKAIYNKEFKKSFHVKKGSSIIVNFTITVPNSDKVSAIKHTLIARTATHTDAEQVIKPILSNRVFITESKVLSVKGNEEKTFTLKSLASNKSTTVKNHNLTLEFTSNPAWYAIQSLPYLMEYEHECSEQLFSRYYANALAQKIANKTPKIKAIFDEWRSKGELKSKLSNNQELKSVLLQETPWVLESQSQEQQQKNIALLFDLHKVASEQKEALVKLEKRQLSNGGWSWFGGKKASWYITQYIVEGMGHLELLGVDSSKNKMLPKAIEYIDQQMLHEYMRLLQSVEDGYLKLEDDNLNSMLIHYLYARSFFTKSMSSEEKNAHNYYLKQAKKYWTSKGIYEKGMIALALHRLGEEAKEIVASLKEHALHNDELGTYFKYTNGYYWNELPIETHALMIEVFETLTDDKKMVENLKIWLLKQRQSSHWKTTKATSSAIYALLSNNDWLESDKLVELSFETTKKYQTKLKEAQTKAIKGLGYYKVSYNKDEFDASMAKVRVKNPNKSIAWGGMYWQYFEDMDKVKSFKETPLTIDKQLFLIEESKHGKQLIALNQQALKVGDKVKVRIEIRVDRDMEYVMLKDSRASTFEPLNVISQYKYQDGLGYYQSTKDNATYFFIDYLRKGTYVFEYPLVVTHKGVFSNGITSMESMYAPEFKSHSEGVRVEVQ